MVLVSHDALPLSNPENYLFTPGAHSSVSAYFLMMRNADFLVCTSDFVEFQMIDVLRRPRNASMVVVHPGGDHLEMRKQSRGPERPVFVRLGTLEARKRPIEITSTFEQAIDEGLEADLVFVGSPSRVDFRVNDRVMRSIESGYPVTWVRDADDESVRDLISQASVFLTIGIEGYGIPSLESLRVGTPVAFSGIQPAAELMEGLGAVRMPRSDAGDIDVSSWQKLGEIADSPPQIDLERIPRWEAFTRRLIDHL